MRHITGRCKKCFSMVMLAVLICVLPGCSGKSTEISNTVEGTNASEATGKVSSNKEAEWVPEKFVDFAGEYTEMLDGSVTVDEQNIMNEDIIGGGMNVAFSDYTYVQYPEHIEWSGLRSQHLPDPDDEFGWKRYKELMDFMGFQYVRLGVGMTQWEPVNDDKDPWNLNLTDGFAFSPNFKEKHPEVSENNRYYMEQMYRLLDHWEQQGKYVVLGNWWAGPDTFCPDGYNWAVERNADGSRKYEYSDRMNPGFADTAEFAESLTAIVVHLKNEKKYECVKGISFYNEPEHFNHYFDTLTQVYQALGKQLEKNGVRDRVLVQAFDGAMFWNRENGWVRDAAERLIQTCGKDIDILSLHDYFSGLEYMKGTDAPNMNGTLEDLFVGNMLLPAVAQNNSDGRTRPVVAGEFGGFPMLQKDQDIHLTKPDFAQRIHSAEGAVQLFNHGGKAIAYWIFNNPYHKYWSALGYDEDYDFLFSPSPENYYPLSLMMKYLQRGTDIVKTTVEGFKDEKSVQRVFITVGVKDGEKTLLLVNDGEKAAKIYLKGLSSEKNFRYYWVNEEAFNGINCAGEIKLTGDDQVTVKPRSITVLTTYTYGSEKPLLDPVN